MTSVVNAVTAPFKAIASVSKSILGGVKKAFKSLTSSTFGRVLLIGATIYLGGAAFGMWNSPFSAVNGAFASPAAAEAGTASAATDAAATAANAAPAAAETGATAGATGAETLGSAVPSSTEVAKDLSAAATNYGGTSVGAAADTASKGIINSAMSAAPGATPWYQKDLVQYGALMAGAGALQGAFTPSAMDVAEKQAELDRQNFAWRQNFLQPNWQVGSLNLGMTPSGQPLRDANGNPIYPSQPTVPGQPGALVVPTPPRGIINRAMLPSSVG